jgi:hypothetical protein
MALQGSSIERRADREAEGARLEIVYTVLSRIQGSNPWLSARKTKPLCQVVLVEGHFLVNGTRDITGLLRWMRRPCWARVRNTAHE